ncbi:hypothetical protein MAUB1S_06285 [Mycolicibacterium aubagnense]
MTRRRHVRQSNLTLLSAATLLLAAILAFGQLPFSASSSPGSSQPKNTELALARQTNHKRIAISTATADRPLDRKDSGRDAVAILPELPTLALPTAIASGATAKKQCASTDLARVYDACAPPIV